MNEDSRESSLTILESAMRDLFRPGIFTSDAKADLMAQLTQSLDGSKVWVVWERDSGVWHDFEPFLELETELAGDQLNQSAILALIGGAITRDFAEIVTHSRLDYVDPVDGTPDPDFSKFDGLDALGRRQPDWVKLCVDGVTAETEGTTLRISVPVGLQLGPLND